MTDTLLPEDKLLIINELPLFAELSAGDKRLVAKFSLLKEYKKGEFLYREGDPPDAFYCIVTGRIRLYIQRGGAKEDLEYLKRGKYFGIISILTGESHSVSAEAVNDSIIFKIPKTDFGRILRRIPRLAIHLSQTLSRRLKSKDARRPRIFESTIISVYDISDERRTKAYALNLAVGLGSQTGKRAIFLNSCDSAPRRPIALETPFFSEKKISAAIRRHPAGIDTAEILLRPDKKNHIIPLLTYLTGDYHYVVMALPSRRERAILESLKQSDMVHIITPSDEANLRFTRKIIVGLKKASKVTAPKIKIITSECGVSEPMDFDKKVSMIKHGIFATLPDIDESKYEIDTMRMPLVKAYPESEYSRAIRRISREVGDCLIGIALGSGAALGLAHIGILKVMERERIPIDIVSGTSMGALIGALWASGKSFEEITDFAMEFKDRIKTLRLLDLTFPKKGLIRGEVVRNILLSQFGNKSFYDLKRPLKIVACDIEKRTEVVLDKGSIADAVMASVAIPGIFEPVKLDGRFLVDGGIVNPLPTNVLMRLGVAKIIAVNTIPSPEDIQMSKKKITNIFDIIVNGVQASEYVLAEISCQNVDVVMHPILATVDWYELYEGSRVIKRGEEEAEKYMPQLRKLVKG